jgi:hypothetical protein
MELAQALAMAERVPATWAPFTECLAIAVRVRRRKRQVNDIEIVAIPRRVPVDLIGHALPVDPNVCAVVHQWPKAKGEPTGTYPPRLLPEGITLDVCIADAENCGLIVAVRTGSADDAHHVLATGWVKAGYTAREGHLDRDGPRADPGRG